MRSECRIRQLQVLRCVVFEKPHCAIIHNLAGDVPVNRYPLPNNKIVERRVGAQAPGNGKNLWLGQGECVPVERERPALQGDRRPVDCRHLAPTDAAGIHARKIVKEDALAGLLVGVQNVERVVHARTLRELVCEPVKLLRTISIAEPQAVVEVPVERLRRHMLKEFVPNPVRIDDARIKRVADAVRAGDRFEIRIGGLERAQDRRKSLITCTLVQVGKHLAACVRAAVVQAIGPECVPRAPGNAVMRGWTQEQRHDGK